MIDIEKYKVKIEDLKVNNILQNIEFSTTKDIQADRKTIGQDRAVNAINFGLDIEKEGYNIYISGCSGIGRVSFIKDLIHQSNKEHKELMDWVYVNNFKNSNEPIALSFKCGEGKVFKEDIDNIVDKIKDEVPKLFTSKEYEYHNKLIMTELETNIQNTIKELNQFAKPKGFSFQVTERGLTSIPVKDDGSLMREEELGNMTPSQIAELREKGLKLNQESKEFIDRIKKYEEGYKSRVDELDLSVGRSLVSFYESILLGKYGSSSKVKDYIVNLCEDIVTNISKFKGNDNESKQGAMALLGLSNNNNSEKIYNKYKVNLFIDNSDSYNRIIEESNPTYYNLIGAIEYKNEIGALTTSFMEIKPGAFHKANGGYLILNIKDVLTNPFSWDSIKRTLKTGKISIESLNKQHGYVVTSTLKPEPIDLDVKVILVGNSYYYSLLYSYEEDFRNLFKVIADFDTDIKKSDENIEKLIQLIAYKCEQENIKHLDRNAVEKLIEYSIRMSDDKNKFTAKLNKIIDIIYEASVYSDKNNEYITKEDIEKAIYFKTYRYNKYEEILNEMFEEGTLLIDIEGNKVGQINGLAVMGNGEYSFGKPSKITASSYKGRNGIINIEREIKKSGSIHDKGVLILTGYLGARYGKEKPLSISTSITFEQNYNGVDGDSASSTELYAIISSISELPINQSIAVTGSVSQKGEIQPIGGVNEKIEGFYDVCKIKGLTGNHGVIIPHQNVKNLNLKDEVIDAIKNKLFTIYSISNIEEGLEILIEKDIKDIDKEVNLNLEKYRNSDKEDKDEKEKNKDNNK